MAERISVAVGELVFDALTAGPADGQLVLLLHGFPQRSLAWAEVLEALAGGGYRVVAPDQRGYSPRARPASVGDYRMECLVSDVLGLADALGTRRFAVVGHDWGGAVAWQLAARHPERAWALTSVSTPHPAALLAAMTRGLQRLRSAYVPLFRAPRVAEALLGGGGGRGLRALLAASGLDQERARRYTTALLGDSSVTGVTGLTAALNWYRAAWSDLARTGRIVVPTLYVWGPRDTALGRAAAEATGGYVDGPYRFVVLEGAGHWIPETRPAELAELLLSHLAASR
jgi:pimeloyl-ACP methyl ester carboxylesterase